MLSILCTDMDYFSQITAGTCVHWSTLRRQILHPRCYPWLLQHPLHSGIPCAKGRANPCLPHRSNSHLLTAGIINTSLCLSTAWGQAALLSPTARPGAADWQVAGGGESRGWRAARTPWPPATDPASRRASLPDTSPRRVTGHWVVSQARKDLRSPASSLRGPCRVPFTVLSQPGV